MTKPIPFRVLDAATPEDFALWIRLWHQWPAREVMAHPSYVQLFAREADRVLCAVTATPTGGILYPFILRPLEAEPWTAPGEGACDTVTPYGYGGAFAWCIDAETGERFWDGFDTWALYSSVVTSFARLSLFSNQLLPFRGVEEEKAPNVVRSLELSRHELWRDYAHKVRKNVAKARRSGLNVLFDPAGERLEEFLNVYYTTLDRRRAAEQYYFSHRFFEVLLKRLRGQFIFCHVYSGERVVSAELILLSAKTMYSFLGGTVPAAFSLRPNDLLKHAVIEWGIEHDKSAYVLGGGFEGTDGIFRYKLSFAPHGTVTFRVGKRVFDAQRSQALVQQRARWERARGSVWTPEQGYFPPYRA